MTLPKCIKCNLYKNCITNRMKGDGPEDASIMFIGEAPGAEEDTCGKPFVGKAGKILMNTLDKLGYAREDFYITNIVKCRPTDGRKNLTPEREHIEACLPYLLKEIETVNPELIVLLGSRAIDGVLGFGEGLGITSKSGSTVEHNGRKYLLCIHPANILYNPSQQGLLYNSLGKIAEFKGSISETALDYKELHSLGEIKEFTKFIKEQPLIAVDIETDRLNFLKANIIGIGFSWDSGKGRYIRLLSDDDDFIFGVSEEWRSKAFEYVKEILAADNKKIFHNGAFDIKCLNHVDAYTNNYYSDTHLEAHLVDNNQIKKLEVLAAKYTPLVGHKSDLKAYMKKAGISSFADVPSEIMVDYCCGDADATFRLHHIFEKEIQDIKLTNFYYNFQIPLRKSLTRMEEIGTKVDVDLAEALWIKCSNKLSNIEQQIRDVMRERGYPRWEAVNLSSPPQMSNYFFGYLKERSVKETPGKSMSIDASVLSTLESKYYEAELMVAYRKYEKLGTTYLEPIRDLVDINNRIHTQYNQGRVSTGRLSSSNPNLQNIPIRTSIVLGEDILQVLPIRDIFIAGEDCVLLAADYSQIELRVLAHYSKDENMINTFLSGGDIHHLTAAKIFNLVEGEKETKTQRSIAKTINFGIAYGISAKGVLKNLRKENILKDPDKGIEFTYDDAEEFIKSFFASFPTIDNFIKKTRSIVLTKGYVQNIFGRRRYFPNLFSLTDYLREKALREAVNMPIQGTAGELTLMALQRIDNKLSEYNFKSRLVLTIHDQLIVEVPNNELEDVRPIVELEMEKSVIPNFAVPLKVDIDVGGSWGETDRG